MEKNYIPVHTRTRSVIRNLWLILTVLLAPGCLKQEDHRIDLISSGTELSAIQIPMNRYSALYPVLDGYGGITFRGDGSPVTADTIGSIAGAAPSAYDATDAGDVDGERAGMAQTVAVQPVFSLHTREGDEAPVVRILEGERSVQGTGSYFFSDSMFPLLPRFRKAVFHNAWPVVGVDLVDDSIPLVVSLEVQEPFFPRGPEINALPVINMAWTLSNPEKEPVEYRLKLTMPPGGQHGAVQELHRAIPVQPNHETQAPEGAGIAIHLGLHTIGVLSEYASVVQSAPGVLVSKGSLEPGGTVTIPFRFAWGEAGDTDSYERVVQLLHRDLRGASKKTNAFSLGMITSTIPPSLLDSVLTGLSEERFTRGQQPEIPDSSEAWNGYREYAGYRYDAISKMMRFAPVEDVLPVRFLWLTPAGWGTLEVDRGNILLKCLHGKLVLSELVLGGKAFFVFREFIPSHDARIRYERRELHFRFPGSLTLPEGEAFRMDLP